MVKLGQAFLAGTPVETALPKKSAQPAPCKLEVLNALVERAKKVQQPAAGTDPAKYAADVVKAAQDLKLGPQEQAQAKELYLARLKNPKQGPAGSPEQLAAEKARLDKIYADPRMSAESRGAALAKSREIEARLGAMRSTDAPSGGAGQMTLAGSVTYNRALTPAQIAALNRVPGAQAPKAAKPRAPAPPSPTSAQKQAAAMAECEQVIKENPGAVRQARNYWIDESKNKSNNVLWRGYAYFNRGLLAVSGLTEVEESAARTGWASAHPDVSARRVAWEGTKLATNSALFAANFVGLNGGAQVVSRARAIDNPAVVQGLEHLGESALGRVAGRAEQIAKVSGEALGPGRARDLKAATKALNEYARTELGGVMRIERGGKWGEANFVAAKEAGEAGIIKYSPMFGKAHEYTHAQQMFVNRAAAMEVVASKAGKSAAQLTAAETSQAMELASRFEKAYYAQHEAQALRTSGILGLFPGSNYGGKLAQNGAELAAAWGGKPGWAFSPGQKLFGALSGMGESQLAIAGTLSAHANIPWARQRYGQLADMAADGVSSLLPPPSLPSERKK